MTVTFKRIVLVIILMPLVALEVTLFLSAKREHEIDRSLKDSEVLEKTVNQMRGAFVNNDEEMYLSLFDDYRDALSNFCNENYVKGKWSQLCSDLRKNQEDIEANKENILALIRLRLVVSNLRRAISENGKGEDPADLTKIAKIYGEFLDELDKIDNESLSKVVTKYQHMAEAVEELAESTAPCMNVCNENTMKARRARLTEIIVHYEEDLKRLNDELYEKYPYDSMLEQINEFQRATIEK